MLKKSSIFALAIAVAACGTDDTADTDFAAMEADTQTMAAPDPVQATPRATAELRNAQNEVVGTATLEETGTAVRIDLEITNLPEGTLAFHIHETGECSPPDFTSAGGHFNPTGAQHGMENPEGPHAGDMPNIEVAADGTASVTVENDMITLSEGPNSVLDADGSALMIHSGADDYVSDPAGDAGSRIACGVITSG